VSTTNEVIEAWDPLQSSPPSDHQPEVARAEQAVCGSLWQIKKMTNEHSKAKKKSAMFEAAAKKSAEAQVAEAL